MGYRAKLATLWEWYGFFFAATKFMVTDWGWFIILFYPHDIYDMFSLFLLVASGKRLHSYDKSPFFMGESTMSMAMFTSSVIRG